jgi:hypothetical protein
VLGKTRPLAVSEMEPKIAIGISGANGTLPAKSAMRVGP